MRHGTQDGARPPARDVPRVAPGTEFLGPYRDSGLVDPPWLVRRRDGQVLQLSGLLYAVAEEMSGGRRWADVAAAVRERSGRPLTAEDVEYLVERKLRPVGLIADGGCPPDLPPRPRHVLALRYRRALLPPRLAAAAGDALKPLFAAPVVACALAGFLALDLWLFAVHGVGDALREAIARPAQLLLVAALIIAAGLVHELGHAAACRRGGARPGAMGVGIYLIWPCFYTDVTDAYRLDRAGRLRTDLGGLYFNVLFTLVLAGAFAVTGWSVLLVAILALQLEMLDQFMPWLRLDGYYVVSDLAGVPDLFSRMGPVLRSLLPGREEPRARELTPRARVLITGWVLTAVPVLIGLGFIVVAHLPGFLAAFGDSVRAHLATVSREPASAEGLLAVLEIGILLAPVLGGVFAAGTLAGRIARLGESRASASSTPN